MGEIADEHVAWMLGENRGRGSRDGYDPLFYHDRVRFNRMVNTTEKAVQLELPDGMWIWVPRSVCRNWEEGAVWIHRKTLRTSMANGRVPDTSTTMPGAPGIEFPAPDDLEDLLDDHQDRPF